MLDALKFVRSAVGVKSRLPIMQHLRIADHRVTATNGVLTMSAPLECDLTVQPDAQLFIRAIQLCTDTIALHLTDKGRLVVKSRAFKAFIPTSVEPFPDARPSGTPLPTQGVLTALGKLAPLMSTDDLRPWFCGVLFAGESAYATNNIMLAEHKLPAPVDRAFGLPAMAVHELLRVGEEPEHIQITQGHATFHYSGDRRLTTSLLIMANWPDVRKLLLEENKRQTVPLEEEFFAALHNARAFTGERNIVWLEEDTVATSAIPDDGARIAIKSGHGMRGAWTVDYLLKLRGIADRMSWTPYPQPCPFFGENLRGVIIGVARAN